MFLRNGSFPIYLKLGILFLVVTVLTLPLLQLIPEATTTRAGMSSWQGQNLEPRSPIKQRSEELKAKRGANKEKRRKDLVAAHTSNARPQRMNAPYWRVGNGFQSTVIINNTMPREVIVSPNVYTSVGEILPAKTITVPKFRTPDIPLWEFVRFVIMQKTQPRRTA